MALLPGKTTLATLAQTIRTRSEFEQSDFVTDDELDGYVNESFKKLRGLLTKAYGADYYVEDHSFTTDGTNETFALPNDYKATLGVDVLVSGTQYASLDRFNLNERNALSALDGSALRKQIRYRERADSLWLKPLPASGQTVRLLYIPRAPLLTNINTITCATVVAGNTLVFTYGDGSTTRTLTAVTSGGGQYDFVRSATDSTTATNLAQAINDNSAALGLSATASGAVVTVTAAAGPVIEWSASATLTLGTWANVVDGVEGWEDYIVLDCLIKVKTKEESEVGVEMADRAAKELEIAALAGNRDAGKPATVVDVYATDGGEWGG